MRDVHHIKFEMMQVHENEIPLRKWSAGATTVQLRTLEGILLRSLTTLGAFNDYQRFHTKRSVQGGCFSDVML